MSTASDNRFTHITPDDHQRWLWFTHIYCPCMVILAGVFRIRRKYSRLGLDDAILLAAHVLYLAYWLLALFALLNSLGKSEKGAGQSGLVTASKLLYSSRIILVLILCAVHASVIALVRLVFSQDYKSIPLWFRSVLAATVCEALFGCLLISVGCSSSGLLEAPYDNHQSTCPHNVARWVAVTAVESIFELVLIVPVTTVVWTVQFSTKTKLQAIRAFLSRLIIWVPMWIHASYYISFLNSRSSGAIDIVPSIVAEELWAAIALISASLPLLLGDIIKLSTSGTALETSFLTTMSGSQNRSQNAPSGSKDPARSYDASPHGKKNSTSRNGDDDNSTSWLQENDEEEEMVLRPEYDRGQYSVSVHAQNRRGTDSSFDFGGHKRGIVHEVSFERKSEPVERAHMR